MTVKASGEENLGELLPHRRPVDDETRGKRPDSFRVRADYCPSQKDGASHTYLVIMRDVQTPDCPSRGVNCCQNRNEVRTVDVVEHAFLVASESLKNSSMASKFLDQFFGSMTGKVMGSRWDASISACADRAQMLNSVMSAQMTGRET